MNSWCLCSADTSRIYDSVLNLHAAEYVVDFCRVFRINSFVLSWCYEDSFMLKHCVADEKVVDYTESKKMLSTVASTTHTKLPIQLLLVWCFIFFPASAFHSLVKNINSLFLRSLGTKMTSL